MVCNFVTNDFTEVELAAELLTLRALYVSEIADEEPSVDSIKIALLALSTMQRKLLGAVQGRFSSSQQRMPHRSDHSVHCVELNHISGVQCPRPG